MKKTVRPAALLLVLSMVFGFAGCAKKNSGGDGAWYDARAVDLELPYKKEDYETLETEFVGMINDKAVVNVFYSKDFPKDFDYSKDDPFLYQGNSLEVYDLDGKLLKAYNLREIGLPGYYTYGMQTSKDKVIIPYMTDETSADSNPGIAFFDIETGKITGTHKTGNPELHMRDSVSAGDYTVFSYTKYENNSDLYLEIIDKDGASKTLTLNGADAEWSTGVPMIDTGNGKIAVPYIKSSSWGTMDYYSVDLKTASATNADDDLMWCGGYNSLCAVSSVDGLGNTSSDEDGLFTIDFGSKKTTRILDYDRCNVNLYLIKQFKLCSAGNNRYVFAGRYMLEDYMRTSMQVKMIILEKTDKDPTEGKTELNFACFDTLDYTTAEAIYRFNLSSDSYHISYDPEYFLSYCKDANDTSPEGVLKARAALADKLRVDILSGEGPDIVMNAMPFTSMIESGLYMDLSGDISYDGYFGNIFEACKTGGKLYSVPLTFHISGIVTDRANAGADQKGFTFDEYKKFVKDICNGEDPWAMDKTDYFLQNFSSDSNEFLNDEGAPDYGSPAFRALAEYVNENVDYIPEPEAEETFNNVTIGEDVRAIYQDFTSTSIYFGYVDHKAHDAVVLGLPSYNAVGPSADIIYSVSVSATSKNKEGCLEFIRLLLSEETELSYSKSVFNIPVNCAAFEKSSKAEMKQYNEERQRYVDLGFSRQDLVNVSAVSEADESLIAKFADIIRSADVSARYDPAVELIIREEMPAYFAGQKSLDEVIRIMSDRTKTYLSERKG